MSDSAPTREHHFYVATAKHVFSHPKHGIVFVRDPISLQEADCHGLVPLTLYGVTVAGTPISWLTFSLGSAPRPFCEVLQEAWKTAPGLLGQPDILKVNRHVAKASPSLPAELKKVGVQVMIADGKDKQFSSSLRSAQQSAMWLNLAGYAEERSVSSLESLRQAAEYSHCCGIKFRRWEGSNKDITERAEAWIKLPRKEMEGELPTEHDWAPGAWLAGWESTLPPSSPRYFCTDRHGVWLLTGHPDKEEEPEDVDVQYLSDEDYENEAREMVKLMLGSWPNKEIEVARELGITGQLLKWYISGHADLPRGPRIDLLDMLGIAMDSEGYYEASGPCVLIARSAKAGRAYEALSHGGDIDISFEALPEKAGLADPSWRYVVFQACGGEPCIVMIPRGTVVAEQISTTFMNFGGQKEVTPIVYRDIVATCAKACATPTANRREMAEFVKRRQVYLQQFSNWSR